jgi:hypothetical protein
MLDHPLPQPHSSDLVIVHEALGFGHCHLALGVPSTGKFAAIDNLAALRDMPCWTEETPLRVVTGVRGCRGPDCVLRGMIGVSRLSADMHTLTPSLHVPAHLAQATTASLSASLRPRASSTWHC